VSNNNAICLFVDNISALKKAYEHLNQSQPDQLLVVVFEEFDRLAEEDEEDLLLLLDGQIQRNNVIFLATTNYFDEIPKRLIRPGRMSSVVCVAYPSREVRYSYFEQKLGKNFNDLELWSDRTEGLTVDELKEIIQAVFILNENLEETIDRLVSTRVEPNKPEDEDSLSYTYRKNKRRR
jgi:SpoVK/Ycf46/Vps4 family AAA+-type ATPase